MEYLMIILDGIGILNYFCNSSADSSPLPTSPEVSPTLSPTGSVFDRSVFRGSPASTTSNLARIPESPVPTGQYGSVQTSPLTPRPKALEQIAKTFEDIVEKSVGNPDFGPRGELIIHEILSKVLAYDLLNPNEPIRIPVLIDKLIDGAIIRTFELRSFTPIAIPLSDGNMAYLFRPVELEAGVSPILIFRGTDAVNASGSLRADLGFSALTAHIFTTDISPQIDVGRSIIKKDGEKIAKLLRSVYQTYGRVVIGGHSLGGKLASSFAIDRDNARFVKEIITFNAPGVTKAELAKYEGLGQGKFTSRTCTVKGDIIGNGIGHKRFFGEKHILHPDGSSLSLSDRHTKCVLSDPATVDVVKSTGKTVMMRRLKIVKYALLPLSITIGIITRIGFIFLALLIELKHAMGGSDKLKTHNKSLKDFAWASQFRPLNATYTELDRRHSIAKYHYSRLV